MHERTAPSLAEHDAPVPLFGWLTEYVSWHEEEHVDDHAPTQLTGFLQQVASLGLVAPDLLLSYTLDPVHNASANAPPPLVVSPHVGTKAGAEVVVNEADVTALGTVPPLS